MLHTHAAFREIDVHWRDDLMQEAIILSSLGQTHVSQPRSKCFTTSTPTHASLLTLSCTFVLFTFACALVLRVMNLMYIKEKIKSNKHVFAYQANARLSTPKQMLNDLHSYTLLIALHATYYFCSCLWFSITNVDSLPSVDSLFLFCKSTSQCTHIMFTNWNCERYAIRSYLLASTHRAIANVSSYDAYSFVSYASFAKRTICFLPNDAYFTHTRNTQTTHTHPCSLLLA